MRPLGSGSHDLPERALRMRKIQRKISGCYRNGTSAVVRANLRMMLKTALKQDWNALETLEAGPAAAAVKLKTS